MPTRACISGPRSSAAINSASIAACHSSDCRVLPGNAMTWLAASLSVRNVLPPGSGIGSSKRRDQGISSSAGLERPLCRRTFAPPAALAFLLPSPISTGGLRCRRRGIAGRSTRRPIALRRIRGAQLSSCRAIKSAAPAGEQQHRGTAEWQRLSVPPSQPNAPAVYDTDRDKERPGNDSRTR
jgi:hypothetical protein